MHRNLWFLLIMSNILCIIWIIFLTQFPYLLKNPAFVVMFVISIVLCLIAVYIFLEYQENPVPDQAENHELQEIVQTNEELEMQTENLELQNIAQMNGRLGMQIPRRHFPPDQE